MNQRGLEFQFWPDAASSSAGSVDALYFTEMAVALFFGVLIATLIVVFAVVYRRRSAAERPPAPGHARSLELFWTIVPLVVVMSYFAWGARLYVDSYTPPEDALEIFVTGKQWMWKIQHPEGPREINELHVPLGRRIKLTMTSEDVIHSFFIPAFRVKKDVVPGRYTQMWFQPTQLGTFHLFCAEYCGAEHSRMIGRVVVLDPEDYLQWLSQDSGAPMPTRGAELFQRHGCAGCHSADSGSRGPDLAGIYGAPRRMTSGEVVVGDDSYLRESILRPSVRVVDGYQSVMPAFQGQITEEGVLQIIAYIKSLAPPAAGGAPTGTAQEATP